jgi:hypothetical protein
MSTVGENSSPLWKVSIIDVELIEKYLFRIREMGTDKSYLY